MAQPAILYVEDEETDVLLFCLGIKQAGLPNPVKSVMDGAEAINYLAGNGAFADREAYPFPALVLLDLNLPRKSGFEVIQWLREQPRFASLPVVIYTSSSRESDREKARQLGASDYIVKPSGVNRIAEMVCQLNQRWLRAADA